MKTYAIPGYAGFINGRSGDSELGRSFTKITRRCLEKEGNFRRTCEKWQSVDFKTDQQTFDKTRPVQFRGYGRRTKYDEHEAVFEEWSTSFRKTYLKPNLRTKPNAHFKLPVGDCEFDNTMKEGYRRSTKASGFQANAQLFDETSWKTEANVHTDIIRTEYRNRFNQPKPFHKPALVNSSGRMPKKYAVYDVQDVNPEKNWKSRMAETQIYAPIQGTEHLGPKVKI